MTHILPWLTPLAADGLVIGMVGSVRVTELWDLQSTDGSATLIGSLLLFFREALKLVGPSAQLYLLDIPSFLLLLLTF